MIFTFHIFGSLIRSFTHRTVVVLYVLSTTGRAAALAPAMPCAASELNCDAPAAALRPFCCLVHVSSGQRSQFRVSV
jgi:hypothetical protein